MKQGFDELDVFCCSLNVLAKLYCNITDAYDKEQAAAVLQRLTEKWHCDENHVIMVITQQAQTSADAQLRYLVQQTLDKFQLPITDAEFREGWKNLSNEDKIALVDSTISILTMMKEG